MKSVRKQRSLPDPMQSGATTTQKAKLVHRANLAHQHRGSTIMTDNDIHPQVRELNRRIERAIVRVWASSFSEHIMPYLQQVGSSGCADASSRDHSTLTFGGIPLPDMAVVIQLQIDSEASGVLFTVDPTAAGDTAMVAEAIWGQGEGHSYGCRGLIMVIFVRLVLLKV